MNKPEHESYRQEGTLTFFIQGLLSQAKSFGGIWLIYCYSTMSRRGSPTELVPFVEKGRFAVVVRSPSVPIVNVRDGNASTAYRKSE
jgi:hypothetical protein